MTTQAGSLRYAFESLAFEGAELADVADVAVDSEGRIHAMVRGEYPLLVFNQRGKLLRKGGLGVDCVVECAGAPAAVRMGVKLLRKQGQLTQMGLSGKPLEVDYDQVVYKDLRIAGSFASSAGAWDKALALMRDGAVQVRPLIGQALPLGEWERGFATVRARGSLKVLLHPQE